jgi:DNA polymerase III subunit delta
MIFSTYGTDHYQVSEKLKELKNGFIEKRDKAGLNVINLDGESITLEQLQQEALTTPFLSEKKMIVIKNLISNKKIGKEIAKFLEENESRIDNILCFVDFVDPTKVKADRSNKLLLTGNLFKYLSPQKYVWEFNLMNQRDLENWLRQYTTKNYINIDQKAITELAIRAGNDLFQLTSELTKLSAFKNKDVITIDDVKMMASSAFSDNIFSLVDSIGNKNKKLAIKLVSDQINFGSHPLMVLSMISRQFKIILKTKDDNASAVSAKIHPFVFNKAKTQGQNFTKDKLIAIINDVLNIERELKSGERNPELLLDVFLTKNC